MPIHTCVHQITSTNDVVAYDESSLSEPVEALPVSYYIVGDNAFINTNHLLTPYSGKQKQDSSKDTFNFYLSQLRIRIEQAFGMLTNSWRIFKSPLRQELISAPRVIMAAMSLHNFLINERQGGFDDDDVETSEPVRILNRNEIRNFVRNYERFNPPPVGAMRRRHSIRESILEEIRSHCLNRPLYNRLRNRSSLDTSNQ